MHLRYFLNCAISCSTTQHFPEHEIAGNKQQYHTRLIIFEQMIFDISKLQIDSAVEHIHRKLVISFEVNLIDMELTVENSKFDLNIIIYRYVLQIFFFTKQNSVIYK